MKVNQGQNQAFLRRLVHPFLAKFIFEKVDHRSGCSAQKESGVVGRKDLDPPRRSLIFILILWPCYDILKLWSWSFFQSARVHIFWLNQLLQCNDLFHCHCIEFESFLVACALCTLCRQTSFHFSPSISSKNSESPCILSHKSWDREESIENSPWIKTCIFSFVKGRAMKSVFGTIFTAHKPHWRCMNWTHCANSLSLLAAKTCTAPLASLIRRGYIVGESLIRRGESFACGYSSCDTSFSHSTTYSFSQYWCACLLVAKLACSYLALPCIPN